MPLARRQARAWFRAGRSPPTGSYSVISMTTRSAARPLSASSMTGSPLP
ncbi:Uncharacterised protein [Bordetella pertussis]|nr:Uncharacterised protein [Bordetella pertussis]CFU06122.1 Uncharacterised protein [Bordetella pertussis]CFW08344.1 Uncharacterised protein [Bordetella pertussis]